MVASFSSSWINATKSSPCPLCGKTDWCSISADGEVVVCGRTDSAPDEWIKLPKQSSDGRNIFAKQSKKAPRPKSARQWIYRDRNGSPLVRVQRTDDGQGDRRFTQQRYEDGRWVGGRDGVDRADIPVYRYQEIRQAIAAGEPIFLVEGESCADALWTLGLPATCNIGGSGKFTASDAADLKGASIVICPDRDEQGIKHAELLAQFFPKASWLYAFPNSYWWQHLPKSQGLDVADWIEQGASKDEILTAIEERRNLTPPPTQSSPPPTPPRVPDTVKISLHQAVSQARSILKECEDEIEANVQLEAVRRACGMGDYSWSDQIVKPLKRELEGDRFKLELLALLQMEDEVERERRIAHLAPKYSMSAGRIEKAMNLMRQRAEVPAVRSKSFDEFLEENSEALDWQIPELLPKGEMVLLIGAPKDGKTLLAIDAAFATATGESEFLGQSCKPGKALLVSVDESAQSTRAKLLKRGFRARDGKNLRVVSSWDISQLPALEAELEEFRPDLVVVDSLKRITAGREISENSAEFADIIYKLKELLGKYGAAGILIHHTNKNPEAMGVGKARGSSAIAGACWGQWQIERIPVADPNNKNRKRFDPKDPRRIFSAFNRDSDGVQLQIEFNADNNSWEYQGEFGIEEEQAREQGRLRDRILAVMETNQHRQLSGRDIHELLHDTERKSVYSELSRMVAKRLISCHPAPGDKRFNLYALPATEKTENHLPPPSPPLSVPVADYSSETLSQQGFEDSLQNSLQIVCKQSATFSEKSLPTNETLTQQGFENSLQNSLQEGGEGGSASVPLNRQVSQVTSEEPQSKAPPAIKRNDHVATTDPDQASYHWHGTVKEIYQNKFGEWRAEVYWVERDQLKIPGGAVLDHRVSELRKLR